MQVISKKENQVTFFYQVGIDPFISAIHGHFDLGSLHEIELEGQHEESNRFFVLGCGEYTFTATPILPHGAEWELAFLRFMPLETTIRHERGDTVNTQHEAEIRQLEKQIAGQEHDLDSMALQIANLKAAIRSFIAWAAKSDNPNLESACAEFDLVMSENSQ